VKSLVVLAVFAAIAVVGVASLDNNIEVWIQEFGAGLGEIESPLSVTDLTANIERAEGFVLVDELTVEEGYKDLIVSCEFVSVDVPLLAGTKLYCKLLDSMDARTAGIIASGFLELTDDVPAGEVIFILITTIGSENSNSVENVKNILIEVQNPPQ